MTPNGVPKLDRISSAPRIVKPCCSRASTTTFIMASSPLRAALITRGSNFAPYQSGFSLLNSGRPTGPILTRSTTPASFSSLIVLPTVDRSTHSWWTPAATVDGSVSPLNAITKMSRPTNWQARTIWPGNAPLPANMPSLVSTVQFRLA